MLYEVITLHTPLIFLFIDLIIADTGDKAYRQGGIAKTSLDITQQNPLHNFSALTGRRLRQEHGKLIASYPETEIDTSPGTVAQNFSERHQNLISSLMAKFV